MYSGLYWSTAEQVGLVLSELQQSKYVVNVHLTVSVPCHKIIHAVLSFSHKSSVKCKEWVL